MRQIYEVKESETEFWDGYLGKFETIEQANVYIDYFEKIQSLLGEVQEGDVVEVREKSRQLPLVLLAIESAEREVPDYMNVNHQKMQGTFMQTPKLADVPYPVTMEPNLVIEFYSR